ncbi:biotin attachment protein [Grimontia sp. AD028]|uniref:biotin/lipoyl-containing protein n=1 Tax=Grimontia sp. AD028 TaxID=1581149 RepID=UPI00061B4FC6|nr:biotin/lipoyl-containing protein [Grimontia sp. AD028]KKD59855.1 biotin attachment protein [Grimontia sp. AD028]
MNMEIKIANDLWEEDEEGVITTWFVSNGGDIEKGEVVAEVMVQKIQYEIFSPATGQVTIIKKPDETVNKGDIIGLVSGD